jgi:hypothetical protein
MGYNAPTLDQIAVSAAKGANRAGVAELTVGQLWPRGSFMGERGPQGPPGDPADIADVEIVDALPGSPVDGQVIFYQSAAMATDGIVWVFRYRAAASGSYKWEFVGGAAISSESTTSNTSSSTSYADIANNPAVTTPLAGDYDVVVGARAQCNSAGNSAFFSFAIGGTAASDNDAVRVRNTDASVNADISASRTVRKAAVAAGTALSGRVRVEAGTGTWAMRWLRLIPVRVG